MYAHDFGLNNDLCRLGESISMGYLNHRLYYTYNNNNNKIIIYV